MKIAFLFICTLCWAGLSAQYSEMTEREMIIRKFRAEKTDISDKQVLHAYMEKFDNEYNSYRRNEFELSKKEMYYKSYLAKAMDELSDQEIFYCDKESSFGEYNFEKSEFKFSPFDTYEQNDIAHTHYAVIGIESTVFSDPLSCAVEIKNLDFVNGLSIPSEKAQALLAKRTSNNYWGGSSIDRKVYLRIYYALHLDAFSEYQNRGWFSNVPEKCLYGEPLKIEVWADKCRRDELLATFIPSNSALPYVFVALKDKLLSGDTNVENYAGHNETNGFQQFITWSKLNNDCKPEQFELQLKSQVVSEEQRILHLRLYTNYNYNIKPGFMFKFYNSETNISYPLVVYEAVPDGNAALLKIKATRQTLNEILNANCYSFSLQLNGTPQYSLPGTYVYVSNGIPGYNYASFNLGDKGRQILFSILKK